MMSSKVTLQLVTLSEFKSQQEFEFKEFRALKLYDPKVDGETLLPEGRSNALTLDGQMRK